MTAGASRKEFVRSSSVFPIRSLMTRLVARPLQEINLFFNTSAALVLHLKNIRAIFASSFQTRAYLVFSIVNNMVN